MKHKNLEHLSIALIYAKNDYQINRTFADGILNEFNKLKIMGKLILIDPDIDIKTDLTEFNVVINRSRATKFLDEFKNKRHIFNQPDFTKMANDKYLTYQWCKYNKVDCLETNLLKMSEAKKYQYPVIVKQRSGHGGKEVFKFNNYNELDKSNLLEEKNIVQKFEKIGASDIRVYVMFKKIIAIIKRTAKPGEFRSNLTIGGDLERTNLSLRQHSYVNKIIRTLPEGYYGLDFFKSGKKLILNEIEDVVGARSLYQLKLKIDIPKKLVKQILKQLKKANHFYPEFFKRPN